MSRRNGSRCLIRSDRRRPAAGGRGIPRGRENFWGRRWIRRTIRGWHGRFQKDERTSGADADSGDLSEREIDPYHERCPDDSGARGDGVATPVAARSSACSLGAELALVYNLTQPCSHAPPPAPLLFA